MSKFRISIAVLSMILVITLIACTQEEQIEPQTVTTDTESKSQQKIPDEIVSRGFTHLVISAKNPSGTLMQKIYTDREVDECSPGYFLDTMSISCLLQIIDTETGEVILELESDETAELEVNGQKFAAPTAYSTQDGWIDDDNLEIISGWGDAGHAEIQARSFNVRTKEITDLYQLYTTSEDTVYLINDHQLFFHTNYSNDAKVHEIYKIKNFNPEEWVNGLINPETGTPNLDKLVKLNEFTFPQPDNGWLEYRYGVGLMFEDGTPGTEDDFVYDIEMNEIKAYKLL